MSAEVPAPRDYVAESIAESEIGGLVINGVNGRRELILEPAEQPGVYDIPNGILTTTYVNMGELYRDMGIEPCPVDWC